MQKCAYFFQLSVWDNIPQIMSQSLVQQALQRVGDASKYQKILIFFMTLMYIEITWMLLGSTFVFMNPIFKCSFSDQQLTEADACSRLDQCQIINDFTITSHAQLYCDDQTYRNLVQSTLYIGSIMGLFIMNMLSDTKGRKFSFILSWAIANVGVMFLVLGAYTKVVAIMAIAQIVIGFGGYSTMIIGYAIISDMCKDTMRQKAILSMNGVWALAEASFAFFYNYYNQWYNFEIIIVLIPSIILFFFGMFFLVETPMFLLTKKQNKTACIESLRVIAKYNKRSDEQITQASSLIEKAHEMIQIQNEQDLKNNTNKQNKSVLYIFKSSKYMKIIAFIAIVEITTNMYYYGVQFSLEQIGTNFGTNILLTGCIEAIAYFSFNLFVTKLPRKKGLFFFNVGSIILGLFFLLNFVNQNKGVASILLCLCRFINTYSQGVVPLLQNESFPSTLQSTGWGIIEGISQLGSFITPFIVGFVTNAKLNPIVIICCVMLVIGLFPIKFIQETLQKPTTEFSSVQKDEPTTQESILTQPLTNSKNSS